MSSVMSPYIFKELDIMFTSLSAPTICVSEELQFTSEMHACLKAERQRGFCPVRYEDQYLSGYHWWLFPNYIDRVFSKVYARMNAAGNLVVGTGDRARLVCISNGRLTLSPSLFEDAVSVSDTRLLVCL